MTVLDGEWRWAICVNADGLPLLKYGHRYRVRLLPCGAVKICIGRNMIACCADRFQVEP